MPPLDGLAERIGRWEESFFVRHARVTLAQTVIRVAPLLSTWGYVGDVHVQDSSGLTAIIAGTVAAMSRWGMGTPQRILEMMRYSFWEQVR